MKTFILQPSVHMTNQNHFENLITYVLFFLIAFVIGIVITRAIFSIPLLLKYQKANLLLLTKIAKQKGVSDEDIEDAIDIVNPRLGIYTADFTLRQIHEKKHKEPKTTQE